MKILLRILAVALVIMALPRFIPGIAVSGFYYAFLAALALGLINLLIKPLIKLVTLPINIFTLGLFSLVINAGLLWAVSLYVPGFDVSSFTAAFIGAFALAVMNWLVSRL